MNNQNQVNDILNYLKSGTFLIKWKPTGKGYSRRFFLHHGEHFLTYEKSKKIAGKARIYNIKDIDEIRTGLHTDTFDRLLKRNLLTVNDDSRAFTILYDNHRKAEHFVAPDAHTRDLWVVGLQHLLSQHTTKGQSQLLQEEKWILRFFHEADKNHSNSLSRNECRALFTNKLNLQMPENQFREIFRTVDRSGEGTLDPDEFLYLFSILTRRKDLYDIMRDFVKNGAQTSIENIHMNLNELLSFLQYTNNQNLKQFDRPELLQQLVYQYEKREDLRSHGLLGVDGFRNMLLSKEFDILHATYSEQIYQDMTRPLCHYYINTSHNTYLFYSQLSGDSNPEAYNRVLLMGGRAVEFDCYDGDERGPIVKHAFTLVKPCTFESIIRNMAPNTFKVSPYPVILNIENHCSPEQQRIMARILKHYYGDQLVTKRVFYNNSNSMPSPEDLKYRVLVRSKKTTKSKTRESAVQDYDENFSFSPSRTGVVPELEEFFIYFENVPYREYEYARANYSPFHSSSLAEKDLMKHAEKDVVGLVQQTTWRLLRVYPDGLRQDSSNPDPVNSWNFGVQLAALNYQTDDDMMALNYGKFLDNGGCGYVLKPDYLINAHETLFNPFDDQMDFDYPLIVTVSVISGQFLPRSSAKSKDIPDSYVKISTYGLPCDKQSQKTKVIDNNGFDPIWNETFEFSIRFPQMCLVYFSVMDFDDMSKDDRVAYFCAPLTMIQTGYRHIRLRANNNDPLHSTLFVHIKIQNDLRFRRDAY